MQFNDLAPNAKEVLGQLFLRGPTWDGDITSKSGRGVLVGAGLAQHHKGWAYLTSAGVEMATSADVSRWANDSWHRKQKGLPPRRVKPRIRVPAGSRKVA